MKKRIIVVALAVAFAVGLFTLPAFAGDMSSDIQISADQTVDGSAFIGNNKVTVAGIVDGDLYCFGMDVVISGTVNGDVLCAARNITIDGTVKGDVRATGAKVTVNGKVNGGATLMGMEVWTGSDSIIGKDEVVTAGTSTLMGKIGRDLMIGAQIASVSGEIGRNATVAADSMTITAQASIAGSLYYDTSSGTSIANGVVKGQIVEEQFSQIGRRTITTTDVILTLFGMVVSFAILTILLTLVAPRYVRRASNLNVAKDFGMAFAVGLASLFIAPLMMFVLAISVVGFYASLVLLVALILMLMVSGAFVAYRLGRFMLADKRSAVLYALVGSVVLGILCLIPYIGILITVATIATGFGMIVLDLKGQYNDPKKGVMVGTTKKVKN